MVTVGDEEPAMVVANLRKALAEIDELSSERASIEEALKEERNRDNILPKLMASSGRSDNIFVEEIKKYDELKVRFEAADVQQGHITRTCNSRHYRVPVLSQPIVQHVQGSVDAQDARQKRLLVIINKNTAAHSAVKV